MKKGRELSILPSLSLLLVLLFVFPPDLYSRGAADRDREYREEVNAAFSLIMETMAAGRMSAEEGKALLVKIRNRYNRGYTDFEGMVDALIDGLAEGRISGEQALLLYRERERQREQAIASRDGESSGSSGSADSSGKGGSTHEGDNSDAGSGVMGGQDKKGGSGGK